MDALGQTRLLGLPQQHIALHHHGKRSAVERDPRFSQRGDRLSGYANRQRRHSVDPERNVGGEPFHLQRRVPKQGRRECDKGNEPETGHDEQADELRGVAGLAIAGVDQSPPGRRMAAGKATKHIVRMDGFRQAIHNLFILPARSVTGTNQS